MMVDLISQLDQANKSPCRFDYFNLGVCYLQIGNLEKSRANFRNAIVVDPFFALAMYYMGYVKKLMNDYQTTDNCFNEAISMIQRNPDHKYMTKEQKQQFKVTGPCTEIDSVDYSPLGCNTALTISNCREADKNDDYSSIFTISGNNPFPGPKNQGVRTCMPEAQRCLYGIWIFELPEFYSAGLIKASFIDLGDDGKKASTTLIDRFAELDAAGEVHVDNHANFIDRKVRAMLAAEKKLSQILKTGDPPMELKSDFIQPLGTNTAIAARVKNGEDEQTLLAQVAQKIDVRSSEYISADDLIAEGDQSEEEVYEPVGIQSGGLAVPGQGANAPSMFNRFTSFAADNIMRSGQKGPMLQ